MDRLLFVVAVVAVAIWLWRPLRTYLLRRLDLTAKVLLIVLPALLAVRIGYTVYRGEVDALTVSLLVLAGLLLLWVVLWGLGRWLDRRRRAPLAPAARANARPGTELLSNLMGVRLPNVPEVSQETLDRAAVTVGRTAGRLVGKWRRSQRSKVP